MEESFSQERDPVWGYEDVALFLGFAIPSLLVSLVLLKLASPLVAALSLSKEAGALAAQFIWYGLLFAGLKLLLQVRYGKPFWHSLGFVPSNRALLALAAGPLLAIVTGLLGLALKAPKIELAPLQGLLSSRLSMVLLVLFAGFLGPLSEEIVFRGFLMPLLVRSAGVVAGIAVTALLFALLHGPEYQWSWRHIILIFFAGAVFGWVRHWTRSTLAAAFIHCTYNLTFVTALISQLGTVPQKW